jgi:protein O-mannosyl-transferase
MLLERNNRKYLFLLAAILVVTLVSYFPVLFNHSFVWDDEKYIVTNSLLPTFNLKSIFTRNVMGNYHPITVLVLALEYHFFGLNPDGYHQVNLLLHLLNVILVFYAVSLICEKKEIALVAALLFGIHPMHVESVAWASGLKDMLYTFFFLLSWIFYLKYLGGQKRKYYFFAFILFFLSLLSKAVAVSLPVVLLLTDYFRGRKMKTGAWLEKAPFFILSLIVGLLAILTQKTSGNLPVFDFTVPQRLAIACYGFNVYLFKFILPLHLSAFYPYPVNHASEFPALFYGNVLIILVLAIFLFFSLRTTKKIMFGTVFFAVTVFFVLQWFPVGKAIMADRYSYLSSIGVFYIAAEGFEFVCKKRLKTWSFIVLGVFTLFFSVKTFTRSKVWKNEITLWSDVISKYDNVPVAYLNRGVALVHQNELVQAGEDFNKAIELNPDYDKAYYNRGNNNLLLQNPEKALSDLSKAIELNPAYFQAYYNRGNIYNDKEEYDKALADYSKAIELDPSGAKAFINRGMVYIVKRQYDNAIRDFDKAIDLNPQDAEAFFNRGMALNQKAEYTDAIRSFSMAIALNTKDAQAFYYRGLATYYTGNVNAAVKDFQMAKKLGYQPAHDFLKVLTGN